MAVLPKLGGVVAKQAKECVSRLPRTPFDRLPFTTTLANGRVGWKTVVDACRSKAPMTLPLLQALQPDRVCGRPARLQARRFALPPDVDNDQTQRQVARWRFHSMI